MFWRTYENIKILWIYYVLGNFIDGGWFFVSFLVNRFTLAGVDGFDYIFGCLSYLSSVHLEKNSRVHKPNNISTQNKKQLMCDYPQCYFPAHKVREEESGIQLCESHYRIFKNITSHECDSFGCKFYMMAYRDSLYISVKDRVRLTDTKVIPQN